MFSQFTHFSNQFRLKSQETLVYAISNTCNAITLCWLECTNGEKEVCVPYNKLPALCM